MFYNVDQKGVFKELNDEIPSERAIPNAKESSKCWGEFRGYEKEHKREATWLRHVKGEKSSLTITEETIRAQCRRIHTWKAPAQDGVQDFWMKKLSSLNDHIAKQPHYVLNEKRFQGG